MLQYLPQLPLVVAALLAFIASASRIFAASKPFWSGRPAWFQMLAPQIALALGALGTGLAGGVKSWTDLTVVFVGAGALLLPGLPSNRSAAPLPSKSNPVKVPPLVGLMLCFVALSFTGCAGWKPVVKDIDQAAVILCDVFFSSQPSAKGLSPEDIEKAFCSTAEQVAPFLDSAKKAAGRGGAIRLGTVSQ